MCKLLSIVTLSLLASVPAYATTGDPTSALLGLLLVIVFLGWGSTVWMLEVIRNEVRQIKRYTESLQTATDFIGFIDTNSDTY